MPEFDLTDREHYVHDNNCSKTDFEEPNAHGYKRCKECSGVFDENGNGVAITDKKFDELYNQE